jgi:adenosine deaminase
MRDLRKLPKADLHLHLEGSARLSTVVELARSYAVDLDPTELRAFRDFGEFDRAYSSIMSVIRAPADLGRICVELVRDAQAQGVGYIEPMFTPHAYCQSFGWPAEDIFDFVHSTTVAEGKRRGVDVGFMIGLVRNWNPALVRSAGEFAVAFSGRGVVAIGIAGPETPHWQEAYPSICAAARAAGLLVVPHAGELAGPESVSAALKLRPHRIAHGVRAVEDRYVLSELAVSGVTCDISMQSNVALSIVPSASLHPLPAILSAGVRVTLGSDDQLFFGDGVLAEYEIARDQLRLSDDQLADIAVTSYRSSGAPITSVKAAESGISDWLTHGDT